MMEIQIFKNRNSLKKRSFPPTEVVVFLSILGENMYKTTHLWKRFTKQHFFFFLHIKEMI